jgi:hypothetical protein
VDRSRHRPAGTRAEAPRRPRDQDHPHPARTRQVPARCIVTAAAGIAVIHDFDIGHDRFSFDAYGTIVSRIRYILTTYNSYLFS